MSYLAVLVLPFLGPFLRSQPFKGVTAFLGWLVVFGAAVAGLVTEYAILVPLGALVFYVPWGWRECHNLWNYRHHGFAVDDQL